MPASSSSDIGAPADDHSLVATFPGFAREHAAGFTEAIRAHCGHPDHPEPRNRPVPDEANDVCGTQGKPIPIFGPMR